MGILLFILGAIMGSFYLVIGTRMPLKDNVITGRSRCDNCGITLKWYELIPILSYLFLGGKCHHCHNKISISHFLVEIISAFLFLFGYIYFGISINLGIYLVSISLCILIFISDFKYMIILDSPLIIGSILLIILKYFELGINGVLYSIFCGISLFITMFIIGKIGNILFKKESLGGGDIKLCFLIGLVLGMPKIGFRMGLICLIFSAFLALPYALTSTYLNKKNELPYGPFLISAMMIIFLFYDKFSNLLVFFTLGN